MPSRDKDLGRLCPPWLSSLPRRGPRRRPPACHGLFRVTSSPDPQGGHVPTTFPVSEVEAGRTAWALFWEVPQQHLPLQGQTLLTSRWRNLRPHPTPSPNLWTAVPREGRHRAPRRGLAAADWSVLSLPEGPRLCQARLKDEGLGVASVLRLPGTLVLSPCGDSEPLAGPSREPGQCS